MDDHPATRGRTRTGWTRGPTLPWGEASPVHPSGRRNRDGVPEVMYSGEG